MIRACVGVLLAGCLASVIGACDGGIESQRRDRGAYAEQRVSDGPAPSRDGGGLPGREGDPCPGSKCGNNLLCLAGLCHKKCVQPNATCPEPVATCSATQICASASSFEDACYPASAKEGQVCDPNTNCLSGNLCVQVQATPAVYKCLKQCKGGVGCTAPAKCIKSTRGCEVCF